MLDSASKLIEAKVMEMMAILEEAATLSDHPIASFRSKQAIRDSLLSTLLRMIDSEFFDSEESLKQLKS